MLAALTKPRSPSYHRRTMLKLIVFAGLLYLLWLSLIHISEPTRPY